MLGILLVRNHRQDFWIKEREIQIMIQGINPYQKRISLLFYPILTLRS